MSRTSRAPLRTGRRAAIATLAAVLALAVLPRPSTAKPTQAETDQRPFTDAFGMEACTFDHEDGGDEGNPLFRLVPGHYLALEGEERGAEIRVEITVCDAVSCDDGPYDTDGTETVDGVETRVVEEREWEDGELVEVSRNYFARCEQNGAVFYFGEDVDDYEDGEVVGHEGAWRAGVDGARAGVVMPGLFLLGSRYFQEDAPEVAQDRAENVADGIEIELEALETSAEDCVEVFETSELASSDHSVKRYCPGIGLVFDDGIELVELLTP